MQTLPSKCVEMLSDGSIDLSVRSLVVSISGAVVTMVVGNLHHGKTATVDDLQPEMLKALEKSCIGVVNLPLQCGMKIWGSAFGLTN